MYLYVYVALLTTTATLFQLCNTSTSTNFVKYSRDARVNDAGRVTMYNNDYVSYYLGDSRVNVIVYKGPDYCECDINQV